MVLNAPQEGSTTVDEISTDRDRAGVIQHTAATACARLVVLERCGAQRTRVVV